MGPSNREYSRYDDEDRSERRRRHRSDDDDSLDRDRRRRDRSRERRRERSRGGDGRSRSRSHRRDYDDEWQDRRSGSSPKPNDDTNSSKKRRGDEPKEQVSSELEDLTKDQRTVFVSQLVMKATERQIRSFFEKVGKVKDVIMIRDKYTNRHKGFAYVEMANLESVPMCLMLNGTLPDFQKFPILVKASEAEKNFLAKQEATAARQEAAERSLDAEPTRPKRTLVVGNLHPEITASDLRTVLAPFGEVDDVEIAAPGEAFVTFADADDALKASTRIAGIELGADRPITVEFADRGPGGAAVVGGGAATSDWRLDTDENGGMAMNAQSRAALMAQLGVRAGLGGAAAAYQPVKNAAPPPLSDVPREAICMANMFDPGEENEPNWRDDIKADVTAECSKYGEIVHVHVDAVSPRGLVHCLFKDLKGAEAAATALHGRWFNSRAITITYVDPRTHRAQ